MDFDSQPDDLNFLLDCSLMAPCAIVALQRVLLLSRLFQKQQFLIIAYLYAARTRPRSFIAGVQLDLQLPATMSEEFKAFHGDFSQCVEFMLSQGSTFPARVSSAFASPAATLIFCQVDSGWDADMWRKTLCAQV